MDKVSILGGKSDEAGGFKYYVKRSLPEPHRALKDRFSNQIKKYRIHNNKATTEEDLIKYYFTGSQLVVNGETIEDDITPPHSWT